MVVEHVPTLPGVERIRARQRVVRARFGPGAAHVWFLAKDPMQFAVCGTLQVKPLLPREVDDKLVPPAWRKAVYANPDLPQGAVDRDAYVVCVLEQLPAPTR
ncbi:hypothetical protein AB0E82_37605 [Streptomyces anulatus]|uniref:hypothetical protein n=1 Tax=Streptomyces anulatus TaxID=1892 RepID=UPI0033F1154E